MAIIEKIGFDVAGAITALNALNSSINTTNSAILSMNNAAKNTGGLTQATKAVQGFTVSLGTLVKGLAIQKVTGAIGDLFSKFNDVSNQTVKFDLQLTRINNILAENQKGITNLGTGLRQAALDTGRSLEEIAEAAQEAFQNNLGETVPETLDLITGAADNLSKITGSTLTSSVNSLSSVLKSYGLTAKDAADVTDTLFVAFDKGRISLEELENRLGTITPQANALKIPFDQAAAAVASLTLSGLNSATAMTQLRNVFDKLIRPTKDLEAAFKKLGVKTGEELIRKFGGLQGALQALRKAFNNNDQAVAKAFNTIRGQLGILNLLANEGGNLNGVLDAMAERFGRAEEAADEVRKTLSFKIDQEYARLNDLLLQSGFEFAHLKLAALQFTREFVQGLFIISDTDTFQKLSGYVGLFVDETILFVDNLIKVLTDMVSVTAELITGLFDATAAGFNALVDTSIAAYSRIQEALNPSEAAQDTVIQQTAAALDNLNVSIEKTKQRTDALLASKQEFGLKNNLGEAFQEAVKLEAQGLQAASVIRQAFVQTNTVLQANVDAAAKFKEILATQFTLGFSTADAEAGFLLAELQALSQELSAIQEKALKGDVLDRQGQLDQIAALEEKIRVKTKEAGADSKISQALNGQLDATKEIVLAQQKKPGLEQAVAEATDQANTALETQKRIAAEAGVSMDGLQESARGAADSIANIPDPQVDATASIGQMQALEAAAIKAAQAVAAANNSSVIENPFYFGGRAAYRAAGGPMRGQDRIPAMLNAGEFVMNRESTGKFFSQLQAMNAGQSPSFREAGGPVTNFGDINVNVAGGAGSENPDQMARQIASGLRRELRRKSSRIS